MRPVWGVSENARYRVELDPTRPVLITAGELSSETLARGTPLVPSQAERGRQRRQTNLT